jgi:hypothetical protein
MLSANDYALFLPPTLVDFPQFCFCRPTCLNLRDQRKLLFVAIVISNGCMIGLLRGTKAFLYLPFQRRMLLVRSQIVIFVTMFFNLLGQEISGLLNNCANDLCVAYWVFLFFAIREIPV